MNDSLLFAGREQRKAAVPPEALMQLDKLGQALGQPDYADKKMDEALTIRWLSKRTGRGEREIEAALPSVLTNYFGREQMDASQAYDLIVATEAANAQGVEVQTASPLPVDPKAKAEDGKGERDTEKYPGWQVPRALGAGFQEFALQIPQGGFSAAAALFGDAMPELNDGRTDEGFVNLSEAAFKARQEAEAIKRLTGIDTGLDSQGKAALSAFEARAAALNEANKQAVDVWRAKNADSPLRKTAEFWRELADATDERWGVDPAFANSTFGQFVKATGSMPATSALMALGGVGLIGVGGATFANVEGDRMAYEGENYDATGALFSNFINAGGQTVLEKVIKLDGVLEKAIKTTAKTGGKFAMSEFMRNIAKTAVGEGVEEMAQGQWDDMVATIAYDEKRGAIPFVDEGVAGRRFYEFMAGAAGGALMAGTFGGALALEQNRNARKAGEYLTTRNGSLLNEYDFKAYRAAYTDAEIADMKDGETLLKAVNGDKQAQADYNKAAAAAAFVNTDGMVDDAGNRLGSVDGKPAVFKADGSIVVIDTANPDAMQAFAELQTTLAQRKAALDAYNAERANVVNDLVDYITRLQAERGGRATIENGSKAVTLLEQTGGDRAKAQEIYERYVKSGDLPPGLDLESLTIMGSSETRWNAQAKQWETAIKIATGAKPTTVIEESVEDYAKRLLETEELSVERVMAWRSEMEGKTDALDTTSAVEWISRYGVAYATGKAVEGDERMPASFRAFLERFAQFVRDALTLGKKLMDMERAGEIPADLLALLQESTGTVAEKSKQAVNDIPQRSEMDAEMAAEAMKADTFPKIEGNEAAGWMVTAPDGNELGRSDTLEGAQDKAMAWWMEQEMEAERTAAKAGPGRNASDELQRVIIAKGGLLAPSAGDMSGELRAIAENMDAGKRLRFFRKNALGLDAMREALNEEGFTFSTVNDLLVALDESTRGKPVYAQGGGETFSVTDSKEFKAWFGDSKVVDAQGKPLVVYRGTKRGEVRVIETPAWFSTSTDDSDSYAGARHPFSGKTTFRENGAVQPVYLSIKNPALVEFAEVANATTSTIERLSKEGFDGLEYHGGKGQKWFVPFRSYQIKSTIGNRGAFDPENPDITMALESPPVRQFGDQSRIDELMAVLEKHGTLYTNARGRAELVRMRGEPYQQAIDSAQLAERQRRKSGGLVAKLALPIDYRVERISPEIFRMLRDRTFQADTKATEDNRVIGAMYTKAKAMGETNLALLDHALANGHADVADALARTHGFKRELDAARAVFESQLTEALELGVPLGKFFVREKPLEGDELKAFNQAIKDAKALPPGEAGAQMVGIALESGFKRGVESYWPRRVMDRDGLLKSMGLAGVQEPFQKLLGQAEAKALAEGRALSETEIDRLVAAANAAAQRAKFEGAGRKPGALKARVLETVTAEQLKFYYKGIDAAFMHNTAMRNYLETLRFFGKSVVFSEGDVAGGFAEIPINVPQSVGAWITDGALAGKLDDKQVKELSAMLVDRFNYRVSGGAVQFFRMFSYLQNMTQITSGITANLAETWQGFYDSGSSPFRYGKNFAKAMSGLSKISLADVGQDPRKVAQEFDAISGVDPKLKEALRGLFTQPVMNMQRLSQWFSKRIGMEYFSRVMKETHMNGAVNYLMDAAQSGSLSRKHMEKLVRIFGEAKANQVLADLRGGVVTDDVKFYAFNVLANWQPISLDQMPQGYLANPYGRVFYMYKTWMSAQFAGLGRAAGEDIASGDAKRVASGVTTLVYLTMLLVGAGIPVDLIVAMIQGRGFILSDSAANRILGMLGMSQFTASQLKRRQWGDFLSSYFLPPAGGAPSDVIDDARALYYAGDEIELQKLKIWRNLPVFGRVFNGYLGHSAEDYQQKIEAAGGRIALTGPDEQTKSDEEIEAATRARIIKQYSTK